MIPQIELDIKVPQETLLWMQYYQINLTAANLDPYPAVIDLKPSITDTTENEVITLTLNPLANITLHPKVKIKGSNIVHVAFFEGIRVAWAVMEVNFSALKFRLKRYS